MSGFLAVCLRLSLYRWRGWEREVKFCGRINKSGFLAVCLRLSLHRGRGWEREVKFCGRINKREIVSKWYLCCSCLVFSRSFVHHHCKTMKCFQNQGEQRFGQICAKSKNGHFNILWFAFKLTLLTSLLSSKIKGTIFCLEQD